MSRDVDYQHAFVEEDTAAVIADEDVPLYILCGARAQEMHRLYVLEEVFFGFLYLSANLWGSKDM